MNRRRLVISSAILVLALIGLAIFVSRQRVRRHRVFRRAAPVQKAPAAIPPVEQWTETFSRLEPDDLVELLDAIERQHPDLYNRWSLGYLHARALIENDEDGSKKLAPFLAAGNPLRDLALYHQDTSASRQTLIFSYPDSVYRDEAIDEETEALTDPKALAEFAAKLFPSAPTERRRDLTAHLVEAELRAGNVAGALTRGFALLRGGTMDDPSDRVSRALDRPELVKGMNAEQLSMMGDALENHRHFDRAVAYLSLALRANPKKFDELQFEIGRSWFGDEKYAEARAAYERGANVTKDPKAKATFLFHASRAAQLMGDDVAGERLLTAAIAVPGKFPATTAAITQRIRTRVKQKRFAEAASDLALLRKIAPQDHALVEGSLAYALGNPSARRVTLNAVPPKLLTKSDAEEFGHWLGRGGRRPPEPPRADAVRPYDLPHFPLENPDRGELLMAMGLYDEAVDAIEKKWALTNNREALTRSLALNRAGAARKSIYAAEVLAKRGVSSPLLDELLYPRYFAEFVEEDAKKFGADPALVLAIMREESRFDPRAKSQAAARGLLQFIITTARDIGREVGLVDVDPEDLYDPRIVIRLGAKYVATLSKEFGGNPYRTVAAYNAGPKQVALWTRLQPAPGDEYFVSSINFDETKEYVRKVMKSYARYRRPSKFGVLIPTEMPKLREVWAPRRMSQRYARAVTYTCASRRSGNTTPPFTLGVTSLP